MILSSRIVMLRASLPLLLVSDAGTLITTCVQKFNTNFFSEAYVMNSCQLDDIDV